MTDPARQNLRRILQWLIDNRRDLKGQDVVVWLDQFRQEVRDAGGPEELRFRAACIQEYCRDHYELRPKPIVAEWLREIKGKI